MSKIPLTIEVELITCAVEICAEVGEQLIILGGSIVGVYQPKKAPPVKAAAALAAPEPPVDREQILEALSIMPMTLTTIRGRVGLKESDNWPLKKALEGLIREGKVFRTGKFGRKPTGNRACWYSLSEAK